MTPRATMSITITCARCGCRTRLAPATYLDSEAVSVVCLGCQTPIRAVVTLPAVEIREPDWYRYIQPGWESVGTASMRIMDDDRGGGRMDSRGPRRPTRRWSLQRTRCGGIGEVCCLRCGARHHPFWPCDCASRQAFLLQSFATAAETLTIQKYEQWRDNGRQRSGAHSN
jgi:hypothetical protein